EQLVDFYTSVLEFEVLGDFKDHDGYNGVFLGKPGENWHLEFTFNGELPLSKFDEDDALVFYPTQLAAYNQILKMLKQHQIPLIAPKNPYWQNNGICFEDCDGAKIIVSKLRIAD